MIWEHITELKEMSIQMTEPTKQSAQLLEKDSQDQLLENFRIPISGKLKSFKRNSSNSI